MHGTPPEKKGILHNFVGCVKCLAAVSHSRTSTSRGGYDVGRLYHRPGTLARNGRIVFQSRVIHTIHFDEGFRVQETVFVRSLLSVAGYSRRCRQTCLYDRRPLPHSRNSGLALISRRKNRHVHAANERLGEGEAHRARMADGQRRQERASVYVWRKG